MAEVMEPSIKGFAMIPTVRRLRQLRESGWVCEKQWSRLEPGDLEIIEEGASATLWYPIASQGRLLDLLAEGLGGGNTATVVGFAHETAKEVLEAPALKLILSGVSALRLNPGFTLIRMANFGFSFGEWRFEGEDMNDFSVVATGVEPLPDNVRFNIQGFMEYLASVVVGADVICRSRRPQRARIIFDCRLAKPEA